VLIVCLRRQTGAGTNKKMQPEMKTMTKKQSTGLIFMLGSAAAAIQLTIFSPVLRGWFYSICLGILIVVFAGGADLFRGRE
jgi:hypothetical protein